MTTAVVGSGGIGSAIAHLLASDGEKVRLSSADKESARQLAAEIGRTAVAAADNRDALRGADAVVLALRFPVLKGVIDELAAGLNDKVVVVPSNPVGIDAQGKVSRLLPEGQSSGAVVAGWLPTGARWPWRSDPCRRISSSPRATGRRSRRCSSTRQMTTARGEEVARLIRTAGFEPVQVGGVEQSGRLEVGGDLHDLVVGPAQARSLIGGA